MVREQSPIGVDKKDVRKTISRLEKPSRKAVAQSIRTLEQQQRLARALNGESGKSIGSGGVDSLIDRVLKAVGLKPRG